MIALRLVVPGSLEDVAIAELWQRSTAGVEVQPGPGDTSVLLAYFPPPAAGTPDLIAGLRRALPAAAIEETPVPDVDWVARFRQEFRSFEVGSFLVTPVWEAAALEPRHPLVVDPGQAFGTGTHESTRLCLLWLERLAKRSALGRVIDLGAGTGLLGIASRRLGASGVIAADIDPEALASCRRHARLNATDLALVRADMARAFRPASCDLLLANLTAPLLSAHARELGALFTRHAILAGLLAEELPLIRQAYSHVDPAPQVEVLGEWAGLLLERRRP